MRIRFVVCLAAAAALAAGGWGCTSRRAGAELGGAYHDSIPLPPDTMMLAVKEPGIYGGRFVFGETSGPKTFNAMIANESSTTDLTDLMYASLTGFDNGTQEDVPALAKSWDLSEDRLTWTYHLRHGLAFCDGHPLTAADVIFSFDLAYDPDIHPSVVSLLSAGGKPFQYSAPDSYTVVFKIAAPYALMNAAVGSVRIMPKHKLYEIWKAKRYESAFGTNVPPEEIVSSGAWRLQQYVENEKVVLTRNPYWFQVDTRGRRLPYLDEVVFVTVPDQNTAALKFRAGELDALDNTKPEDFQTFKQGEPKGGYTVYDLGSTLNTNFFFFNLNRKKDMKTPYVEPWKFAIFNNPEFRRAMSEAVDREPMIRGPLFGRAFKNWASTTSGNRVWHDEDVVRHDYDPESAKRRLAGMGLKDANGDGYLEDAQGHTVSFLLMTNADNEIRKNLANMISDDLKKVGIKATLAPVDFNTLITRVRENRDFDAVLLGLQSGVPPDPAMGQNVYRSSGKTHYWYLEQPKPATPEEAHIDKLMDQLISSYDLPERKGLWKEIKNTVNDQCWIVWLPSIKQYVLVSNKFGNVEPSIIPHRILWNIERVYRKPRA